MSQTALAQAVETFARVGVQLSDAALEKDWKWGAHDEGIRFAFFVTYLELRALATQTAAQRAIHGPAITSAQRIMAQYHEAYRDLWRLSHIMVYVDGKFKLANVGCPNRLTSS